MEKVVKSQEEASVYKMIEYISKAQMLKLSERMDKNLVPYE